MNTELYIEGYRLDLSTEISALLTFAIDDIKNFSARSTTWSKTIVLPGTANNNRLFGHIFQVGQSNGFNGDLPNVGYNFNAAKSANIILFQDQIQTFKGVLRLLQINYYGGIQGRIEYEVSIFGNISGLNSILTGSKLEDLDFSIHDQTYSVTNIVNSWDNAPGSGIYYPLIDYGNASVNKHDWDIKTFRPALYLREYIDKMFAAAGYRFQCPLFDSARFQRIIIPHNQKELRVNQSIVASGSWVITDLTMLYSDGDPDTLVQQIRTAFPTFLSSIFDPSGALGGGFNNITFTYTDTPSVTLTIEWNIVGRHYGDMSGFDFLVRKNGVTLLSTITSIPQTGGTSFVNYTITGSSNISFVTGDTIEFWFTHDADGIWDVKIDGATWKASSATGSNLLVPIVLGQTLVCNDCIPKNIRQIDVLVGIIKLWNLYVYEDKNDPYLVYITPYIDFYSKNTSNAIDWTHKLNNNKAITSRPMSELNAKIYKLKFKSDSDHYNELYRKRYNEGYGDRIYDSEFEFSTQTSEFEVVFSATPLIGYNGEDKVYSTILKQTSTSPTVTEESIDSNIRLLLSKKITGVTPWNIKNGTAVDAPVLNTLTRYGYAGHLDDPDIPADDLNFGAPKELFFILTAGSISNNQFNVYWANYMREITDKDSKLIKANFYLTAKDILNLDFSKYIYVNGIAYRLNAIRDYNASKPADCVVELLKVNSATYTIQDGNDGPPAGCYLLWSDDNTLDYDTGEELLYGDCNTNPGDGGPNPPVVHKLNWSWQRIGLLTFGTFRIYVDGSLMVISTLTHASGSFDIADGQEIRVEVSSNVNRLKRIFISNSIDGVLYDNTTTGTPTHVSIFTIESGKDYTVIGSAQTV